MEKCIIGVQGIAFTVAFLIARKKKLGQNKIRVMSAMYIFSNNFLYPHCLFVCFNDDLLCIVIRVNRKDSVFRPLKS